MSVSIGKVAFCTLGFAHWASHDRCVRIDYLARRCHKTVVAVCVFVPRGQQCHLESGWKQTDLEKAFPVIQFIVD